MNDRPYNWLDDDEEDRLGLDEDSRVEVWNASMFAKQGFDGLSIATLLAWGVSPHETHRLVSAGCPHDLALKIVAPLDDETPPEGDLIERLAAYSA